MSRCNFCGRVFQNAQAVKAHLRKVHSISAFQRQRCDATSANPATAQSAEPRIP